MTGTRRERRYWSSHISALVYRLTYTRLAHQLDDELFGWLGTRIRGAVVVDCGCGPGVVTAKLLARGAARVYAVDVNASMLRQARARIPPSAACRAVLLRAAVDADFWTRFRRDVQDCTPELILWKRSLYAPRPAALATLRGAVACLAPGGALVVIHGEPSLRRHCFGPWLRPRSYTAFHLFNRAISLLGARLGVGDYALYRRAELLELLREASGGGTVEEIPTAQRAFILAALKRRTSETKATEAG